MDLKGAYLNLDGGFDSAHNRKMIFNAGMIPNIKENPRNRKATSASSRLRIGVDDFGACWEASDDKEVSHAQEVCCTALG